jgi:hypothetical protein
LSLLVWPAIKPVDAALTSVVFILVGWLLTALVGLAVTTSAGNSTAK